MSFDPSMWFMLSELDAEEEREKCGVTIQTLSPRYHRLNGCQEGGSFLLRHVV